MDPQLGDDDDLQDEGMDLLSRGDHLTDQCGAKVGQDNSRNLDPLFDQKLVNFICLNLNCNSASKREYWKRSWLLINIKGNNDSCAQTGNSSVGGDGVLLQQS